MGFNTSVRPVLTEDVFWLTNTHIPFGTAALPIPTNHRAPFVSGLDEPAQKPRLEEAVPASPFQKPKRLCIKGQSHGECGASSPESAESEASGRFSMPWGGW